jgi:hypothetical protein
MRPAELIFFVSLAAAAYAYVAYPLAIALLARVRPLRPDRPPEQAGDRDLAPREWPSVTVLMTACREEAVVVDRLRDAASVDYPPQRLQIVLGCEGDDDLTGLMARSFDDPRVRVVQYAGESTSAIHDDLLRRAETELVVLCPPGSQPRADALRRLVKHFQDPVVAAVCGPVVNVDRSSGRTLGGVKIAYENAIRRWEARCAALAGLAGGLAAARRGLCLPLGGDSIAAELLLRVRQGRVIYDDRATAVCDTVPSTDSRDRRELRPLGRLAGLKALCTAPLPAIVFALHRLLRRIGPVLLITAFISNAWLADEPFFLRCLLVHELCYLVALAVLFLPGGGRCRLSPAFWGRRLAESARLLRHGLRRLPGKTRRNRSSATGVRSEAR